MGGSKKKNIVQLLFVVVITIIFALYIKRNYAQIKDALSIKPVYLVFIALLNLLNKLIIGLKTKRLLKTFKIKLSFMEWFSSSIINNFYNYLMPKGGTTIMGIYFKNKHSLDYHRYLTSLLASGLVTILSCGILGAVISLYARSNHLINSPVLPVLFIGMFIFPLSLFFIPNIKFPQKGIGNKINSVIEGWHILRKDKKMLFFISLMDMGIILVLAMRYYIIFRIFSLNISLANCIIISPFNIIMHFVTIIPGGYGAKELIVGLVSKMTNIGFDFGILATLTERIIMMTLAFILGPIFSFLLLKKGFSAKKEALKNE